jgi:hypothetical protein
LAIVRSTKDTNKSSGNDECKRTIQLLCFLLISMIYIQHHATYLMHL